jgi:DNA-binding transcriptional regulator YdaS (Cro superfamily)
MRPTSNSPGAVWRLLDDWAKAHPLKPNQNQLAGLIGVSSSLVSSWKYCQSMMQPDDMTTISERTGIAYDDLARAVREDTPRILEHVSARRNDSQRPRGATEQRPD